MQCLLEKNELIELCVKQLSNLLVFDAPNEFPILHDNFDIALERIEHNFSHNKNKYYSKNGEAFFNPFHSGQYSVFLYYLSNAIWKTGNGNTLADRIYYLNKIFNSVDLYYEIELPNYFSLDHPLGTVMGRANYSNYFVFSQNCTVGNNNGIYPTFEEKVCLFSGATVIGNSHIGKNCLISANSYVKDTNIPSCSVVFGSSPSLIIKEKPASYFDDFFNSKFVIN